VLLILAHFANHRSGECSRSIALLARETGLSGRTVARKLQALRNQGLIEIVPAYGSDGRQLANRYNLMPDRGYDTIMSGGQRRSSAIEDCTVPSRVHHLHREKQNGPAARGR
jgi:hypothetical protein